MCACRQRKSFLIEDILRDTKKKPYKNLSNEPSKPLYCRRKTKVQNETEDKIENSRITVPETQRGNPAKSNVVTDEHEKDLSKVNLESRRNTYPLYPTAVKPSYPWNYRKEPMAYLEPTQFSYYSDPILNTSLRSQLAANQFASHTLPIRQAYGFDRVSAGCCNGWWVGGRRKGGQVRFTAAQTGALERRFGASKYLSPDERRALASTLRLSDRQVKTWFQNRRAKWRRAAPDSADAGSPASDDGSEDDVHITD